MWPRTIYIRGVGIPVESWDEIDELIQRYGEDQVSASSGNEKEARKPKPSSTNSSLTQSDRALLERFIEGGSRGVINSDLTEALGKRGKGIKIELEKWARRVGISESDDVEPFESFNRYEGRGYYLKDHFLRVAQSILGAS